VQELDDLTRVIEVVTKANPRAVSAEVKNLRAGPKGPVLGRIGHSAEQPLPLPDALDRRVTRLHRTYKRALDSMRHNADEIERIERELLTRLHDADGKPTPEARAAAGDVQCSNCGVVIESTGKALGGRCRNCHDYQKNHDGQERPRDLIDREVYGKSTT
jgi:hypothetical protein